MSVAGVMIFVMCAFHNFCCPALFAMMCVNHDWLPCLGDEQVTCTQSAVLHADLVVAANLLLLCLAAADCR